MLHTCLSKVATSTDNPLVINTRRSIRHQCKNTRFQNITTFIYRIAQADIWCVQTHVRHSPHETQLACAPRSRPYRSRRRCRYTPAGRTSPAGALNKQPTDPCTCATATHHSSIMKDVKNNLHSWPLQPPSLGMSMIRHSNVYTYMYVRNVPNISRLMCDSASFCGSVP